MQLLEQIAQTDKDAEQRSDALFWLAQEYPQQAKPILVKFLQNERDDDALEQAVFAISQLGDNSGDELLFELARYKNASREVRRQALFWLAQSDNDATVSALAHMLSD
jgi:HEAT repeat protein